MSALAVFVGIGMIGYALASPGEHLVLSFFGGVVLVAGLMGSFERNT